VRIRELHRIDFSGDVSGSTTVEFVCFAPVLIAALFLVFDFGYAFWAFDVMTRDVRTGLRYASRMSTPPDPMECPQAAKNIVQTGFPSEGNDRRFPWNRVPEEDVEFSCTSAAPAGVYNSNVQVITMTVTATLPMPLSPVTYPLSVSYQARYLGN
jgi:hypothetical protein